MKKIISILLTLLIVTCSMCVCSAEAPSLDFLEKSALCEVIEQSGAVDFKLNKPFTVLEELQKSEDFKWMSNHIDIVSVFESLFDSTMNINAKVKLGDSKKEFEAHIKSNVPFKINDNLDGDVRSKYDFWGSVDFSDDANPYFDMIMSHPFAAKYITVDSELLKENDAVTNEEILEVYKATFDAEKISELNQKTIESIKKNASINKTTNGVKIQFTDAGLKLYIADVIEAAFGVAGVEMLGESDLQDVKKVMSEIPFFADEALVLEYMLDDEGRIATEKAVLNVKLNLYDLMAATESDTEGLTKENSTLDFTVTTDTSISYDDVEIKRPELTEENSVDIFEFEDPYYYDPVVGGEYKPEEDYYYSWSSAHFDDSCIEDGKVKYVKFRSFFEDMGYTVSYDNGYVRAKINSSEGKFKEYCIGIGSDVAYTDIHDVNMIKPLILVDGTTYISVEDCENLTFKRRESVTYEYSYGTGMLHFWDENFLELIE